MKEIKDTTGLEPQKRSKRKEKLRNERCNGPGAQNAKKKKRTFKQ